MFLGFSVLGIPDRLAYEFDVFGDFAIDIMIGNFERKAFCAIELEDARSNSVFHRLKGKATAEWGHRVEHGFSQLVDWFYSFDGYKNTPGQAKNFGYGHIQFFGLLLVGRSAGHARHEADRLRWRSDKISINGHKVYCQTYDEIYEFLDSQWRLLSAITAQK